MMRPYSTSNSRMRTTKKDFNKTLKSRVHPPVKHDEYISLDKLTETIDYAIAAQKYCYRRGKYVEAYSFKRKVRYLRDHLYTRELEDIKQRHQNELIKLEEAHLQEMNLFNMEWDSRIDQYGKQVEELSSELAKKHEEQLKYIEEEIDNEKTAKFKEGPKLLELRKIYQYLAKQENYLYARKVQLRVNKLLQYYMEKWRKNTSIKNRLSLDQLRQKHENELMAMNRRIEMQIYYKYRYRNKEQDKLVQKYNNIRAETEYHHSQEMTKFHKAIRLMQLHKTKVSLSTSRHSET